MTTICVDAVAAAPSTRGSNGHARYADGLVGALCSCSQGACRVLAASPERPRECPESAWMRCSCDSWQADVFALPGVTLYHHPTGDLALERLEAIAATLPYVITMHDLIALQYYMAAPRRQSERRAYRQRLASVLQNARRIVSVSNATRNALLREFTDCNLPPIDVVYPGVSTLFSRTDPEPGHALLRQRGIEPGKYSVLVVGAFSPHKGFADILRATANLLRQGFDASVLVVGAAGRKFVAASSALAVHLDVRHRVHFLGPVADTELVCLYSYADVLACPSRVEGFGFPPVEALWCGCPVVAADVPIFHEVLGNAVAYAPIGDSGAWASALASPVRHTNGNLIADLRCKYSWGRAADGYRAAYHAALEVPLDQNGREAQ